VTAIAMTREMGSLGRDVALSLAERLGLELVQHEIVANVAEKMQVRESSVNRFLEGQAGMFERWGINESDLSLYTTEEILKVAQRGNVLIRGWGATYVLRDIQHVLCVRVCAPIERRTDVMLGRLGIQERHVARREIERNDAAHARTMLHNFNADYKDPLLYDLVLNNAKTSTADCVGVIENLVKSASFAETDASRQGLAQRLVEAEVQAVLRDINRAGGMTPWFEAYYEPSTGTVTLRGAAYEEQLRKEAERLVRELPQVKDVRNDITVLRPYVGT